MKLKNNWQGKVALLLILLGFSSGSMAQDIKEDLSDFSEVKVYNGVEVELISSEENRILITGHSKEKVDFEVVENRLEIRLSLENIWSDDNTLVTVYAKSLETIDANEGSIVDVKGDLKASFLTFRSQEGAAIYAGVSATRVSVKAVTAGIVQLNGKAGDLEAEINTGGKFFGEHLEAKEAEVSVGTGGHVDVNASEYLKATAKMGGVVNVFGDPEALDRKTSFGGRISKKN